MSDLLNNTDLDNVSLSATAAHLEAARKRGRRLMAEGSPGIAWEWLHAGSAARDGTLVVFILSMVLFSAAETDHRMPILLAAAIAFGIYTGVANMLAAMTQLRQWEAEFLREREEIRTEPEREREELRALYEAKGFSGPVLDEIVETLCVDEERLLKIMLEEELGIFVEQSTHPVLMGLLTGFASMGGGLIVAAVAAFEPMWLTAVVAAVVLAVIATLQNARQPRESIESFARWAIGAGTVGGIAYYVSDLLHH